MPGRSRSPIHLGTFLHHVKGCRLILSAKKAPKLGQSVYDSKLNEIGRITNIFGPVSTPFVQVRTKGNPSFERKAAFYLME